MTWCKIRIFVNAIIIITHVFYQNKTIPPLLKTLYYDMALGLLVEATAGLMVGPDGWVIVGNRVRLAVGATAKLLIWATVELVVRACISWYYK